MQYHLRWYYDTSILQVSRIKLKPWEAKIIGLINSFDTNYMNYILNNNKNLGQYDLYAILSQKILQVWWIKMKSLVIIVLTSSSGIKI